MTASRSAALDGVRVLDVSRVLAGPYAASVLGDLGAEVIKLEDARRPDETRGWGARVAPDVTTYFAAANRNKRAIAVDLKAPDGRAIAQALASRADVVIENFKLGHAERYGLDYATLAAETPRIIVASISGYGRVGPDASRAGYDLVVQGESGVMMLQGRDGDPPAKVGVAVVDLFTGMGVVQAVMAALIERGRSGRGQWIDASLHDHALALLANVGTAALASRGEPARWGNAHASIVPYEVFATSDGWVTLGVGNDEQFRRMCVALDRPELACDGRFADNAHRVANREALRQQLATTMTATTAGQLVESMSKAEVPCGRVKGVLDALEGKDARARGMVWGEDVTMVGSPLKLAATPTTLRRAPPRWGEHTDEVLGELGFDAAAIARLRDNGVVR